ncbi:DUF4190 domain-containing protein [Labedaea rhizosphaerae]|uniref:Uncharacterized protein DUF4190 n=1 Tax=Labedaea rhizosphaerae TaxID=598644 RepID=A0A4V3CZ85_LABRH|nr:DUF4190 domain-containing protein [Labedaea rhizosphaerae]TDP97068.1 uncharacterized protein DUF4190 [Labedaea rhizosphaerae]
MTNPQDWQNQQGAQPPQTPPPGFQQTPPPGYQMPPAYAYPQGYSQQKTNGMAVAALVLGILGFFLVTAILAIIFGFLGRSQIAQRGEKGDGMAIAGLVLGIVWCAIFLVRIIAVGVVYWS